MTKAALRDELLALLEVALAAARAAHAAAIEGSTHPEAKAENEKDTRGLEQSYLARGVAQRVADLEAAVAEVTRLELRTFAAASPVAMSALVTADEEGEMHRFFLAPAGGGSTLAGGVQVLTTSSPLGRALLGKRVDDDVELKLPGKTRTLVVTAIS
jgi:hypothetical protein